MVTCHGEQQQQQPSESGTASASPSQVTGKTPQSFLRRGVGQREIGAHVQQGAGGGAALEGQRHRRRLERLRVLGQVRRRLPQQRRLGRPLQDGIAGSTKLSGIDLID
jgi:hypothetical protein